jgi:hypothetical protein
MPDEAISLREYIEAVLAERQRAIDAAFAAQKSAIDAALTAAERAVAKAETANEKRFESVNEFRATLKDQQASFITRSEAMTQLDAMREKLNGLVLNQGESKGKGLGLQAGWGYLLAAVGLVSTIIAIVLGIAVLKR